MRILLVSLLLALALPVVAGASPTATTSIVGGQPAPAAAWPAIAFLLAGWDETGDGEIDASAGCTGTVIAPEWILTAAHCALRPDGGPVDAMLSITGVADVDDPVGEAIAADELVMHPGWNPSTLRGDALLLHLATPSGRTPMPLARPGGQYGTDPAIPNAAGWGMIDEDSTIDTDVLQQAYLDLVDDATCATFAGPDFEPATQLCAGTYAVAGVCHGDSGGPLTVVDAAKRMYLYGLTSYGPQPDHAGFKPCDLRSPAVFTRVPAFAGWVDAQTAPLPPPPPGPGVQQPSAPRPVPATPRDTTRPVLSRARLSAKRLRPARRGATIARRAGAKLSFSLSEAAAVRVAVVRRSRALAPTATIAGQAGRTTRRFTGRVGGRRLKPGRYALQLGAVDAAGNAGKVVRLRFRVVRR